MGGAQRQRTRNWNISYRIDVQWQGRGLATELARVAIEAAGAHDPSVAILAWVLEQNAPSRHVAERAGLINRGPHVDPDDGNTRLAYSDRPL